jgi:hypothetical protein
MVVNENITPIEINYLQNDYYVIIDNIKVNSTPIDGNVIFDTGNNLTVIDNSVAQDLNIKTIKKVIHRDISGRMKFVPYVKVESLNVNGAVFRNVYAMVIDLSLFECENLKIILGDNVLNTGIWKIDMLKHKITLYNQNEDINYDGFHKIPFSHKNNWIKLKQFTLNGSELKNIKLDTGNPIPLTLSLKGKIKKETLIPAYSYEYYMRTLNKVQPKKIIEDYYFTSINLNGLPIDSVFTVFTKNIPFRLIGLNFFKNSTMIIDYKNSLIGIKEPFFMQKPNFENVGISFDSFNDNEVVISTLRLNSPADKLGVKVGDKVQKINGFDISEFSLTKCELIDSLNSMTKDTLYLKLEHWDNTIQLIPEKI